MKKSKLSYGRRLRYFGAMALGVGLAGGARAQTYSWNNFAATYNAGVIVNAGGGTPVWSDNSNWASPPTFGQNAILSFASSNLQVAGYYASNIDQPSVDVNGFTFNFEGTAQNSFFGSGGVPYVVNLGDGSATTVLHMRPSATGVAPTITQNGSGAVVIRTNVAGSLMTLEGTLPVQIGGTGIGAVELGTLVAMGDTPTVPVGFVVNFSPSAVRANNTGATFTLSGAQNPSTGVFANNTFLGDVVLQNGNLCIAASGALGQATNRLVINAGSNSLRVANGPTIANPVFLGSTMNFTSMDGSSSTWTGAWSGGAGINLRPSVGMIFNMFGTGGFTGPVVLRSNLLGYSGTANDLVFNLGSSTGGATTGTLTTTNLQLFAGSRFVVTNVNGNAARLATGTNLTMYRSSFSLLANATAGNDAAETLASLTNTGMSTLIAAPATGTATGATLTFGSWTRQGNATALFVAPNIGSAPGANVGNIIFTANPGGATSGSTIAGTQNLAVLPYAYTNAVPTVTTSALTSLARYDSATGRIVPLNIATEYASNLTLASGSGAAGLNYRLAGAGNGGVASLNGPVTLNGIVIDTNQTTPPPVGVSLVGNATLNLTGPVLSTYTGSGFPATISSFLPNQIAVAGLKFGANTAYFHTPGDLWVSSPISGSAGLVKSGESGSGQADLYLFATNSFSGGLTINGGRVMFTNDAQLGAAGGGILMNSGGNGGLFFTQNPFYDSTPAPNVAVNRPLTIGAANGSIGAIVPSTTLTYSGPISGTGGLVVNTAGITVLANSGNSFVGDVVLRSGTTIASNDGALGDPGNRILMGTVGGTSVFQPGAGFTSMNREFVMLATTGSCTIFTNGVDLTVNGVISSTQSWSGVGPGFNKGGLGTLTLTAANTVAGAFTVGDTAGTSSRVSSPNGTQLGGTLRLSGANGSLPFASAYTVNDAAALTLDNIAAVNNDRIGMVNVSLGGGSFNLLGNAAASVTERIGAISAVTSGTITLTQPTSAGGQSTSLQLTALSPGGTLFVRGTNLGAATGDITRVFVSPANLTTALPLANGIIIGAVAAASDTSGPTDFLTANIATAAVAPNVARYSLAPLATYGSLTAPGATVNADQSGSTFAITGATDLNSLRIGSGGGVNLGSFTLKLGTATANERSGMILAAGGPNSGITGGVLDFGSQTVRVIASSNLAIGSSASPTTILGNSSGPFIKTGTGTLTLFGTAATTLAVSATASGSVTVAEGTLVLGNSTALGRSTFNATSIAPIPNLFPTVTTQKGSTFDISQLSASPVRINTYSGSGTLVLGDTVLNNGSSSSNIGGNITGTANSKFIVGLNQSDIAFNTFGGGGPALTGDNSGFLGQWQVLRGTLNFASNLSFGTGTSPILFSDTATNGSTGTVSLRIDAGISVPFPRDVVVPAGGFALPTFLVGNSSNVSMTGSLVLGKSAGVSGTASSFAMFTFAGPISGVGQLQLGTPVFSGSGNISFAAANPDWSGGLLMNTGQGSSTNITNIVAVGTNTSLGTGTLVLGQIAGLLRPDGGARTLANAIDVTNTTPTSAFTTNFGSTGVNDLTLAGNVRGVLYTPFNVFPAAVPAAPNSHTLNLNSINLGTTTFSGTISNGAAFNFGIVKNGPGLVAFNGNNTYTGDTVVNAGTLRLGNPNALGFGGRQAMTGVIGGATVNSGAILDLNGQVAVNKPIALAGGSLLNNSPTPASVAGGTLSSLTIATNGNPYSTVPTVTLTGGGGTGAAAAASLGLQPASFTFTPLTQGGSGYSSAPTVSITGGSGATARATLGVTAQTFTITNGGAYSVAPTSVSISGSGVSGATTATATVITSGVSPNITVTGVTITNPGSGYLFAPTITFSGGTSTVAATGIGNATNFQVGSVTLTNPGGGFSSAPTFNFVGGGGTGATVTTNGTNFALGLQVTAAGSGYTSAPTVAVSGSTATATAVLSTVTLTSSSFMGGSGDLTVNAPVSGAGGLTKVGTGTLNLTANNTYGGGTTISAGILAANNTAGSATGTGAVTVNAGGTLRGVGSISPSVVDVTGGTIKGGNSPGTLTIATGNLNMNANAIFQIDLRTTGSFTAGGINSGASGSGGADNSRVTVTAGSINFTSVGTATIKVVGDLSLLTPFTTYSFLVGSGTSVTGLAAPITGSTGTPGQFNLSQVAGGGSFTFETSGNNLYLNVTPVPEPTSILGLGFAGLLAFRRIRRKSS